MTFKIISNTALHSSNTKLTILWLGTVLRHFILIIPFFACTIRQVLVVCALWESFKRLSLSASDHRTGKWHSRNSNWLQSPPSLCKPTFYCLNSFSFGIMLSLNMGDTPSQHSWYNFDYVSKIEKVSQLKGPASWQGDRTGEHSTRKREKKCLDLVWNEGTVWIKVMLLCSSPLFNLF